MNEAAAYQWLKAVVRTEMVRQNITYKELLRRLGTIGVEDTETNLRNKIGRGKYSALLLVQCLEVMGIESLKLDMLESIGMGGFKPRKRSFDKWGPMSEAFGELMEDEVERLDQEEEKNS